MSYKSPINLKESRNRNKRQLKLLQSENSINALPFNLPVLSSTQMERMSIIAISKLKALAKEKYFGRYSPQEDYNNLAQRNSIDKTIESKQVEIKIKRTEVARNSAAFFSSYLKSMKKEHSQDSIKLDKVESNHEYRNNYLNKSLVVQDLNLSKFENHEDSILQSNSIRFLIYIIYLQISNSSKFNFGDITNKTIFIQNQHHQYQKKVHHLDQRF